MKKNLEAVYAAILFETLKNKKEKKDIDAVILKFLNFLKNKSHLYKIKKIIKEFEKIYNQENKVTVLKIKSAYPLDTNCVQKIISKLKLKKYEAEFEIDKNIIGGFIINYNHNLIDASLASNLNKLYQMMLTS